LESARATTPWDGVTEGVADKPIPTCVTTLKLVILRRRVQT